MRWSNRVLLNEVKPGAPVDDAAVDAFAAAAEKAFPEAGWQVRTRANVSPQFEKNLARFTQFLTLVGLTALIVGGVGVANAVRAFIDRKRPDFATLKSLGATGAYVFNATLIQVLMVAVAGVVLGLVIGLAIPFALSARSGRSSRSRSSRRSIRAAAAGLVYGVLTALAFSLIPIGRAHDVPVSGLFRDVIEGEPRFPRRRYIVMTLAAGALLAIAVALSRPIASSRSSTAARRWRLFWCCVASPQASRGWRVMRRTSAASSGGSPSPTSTGPAH